MKNQKVEKIVEEKFIFSTNDTTEFFGVSRETLSTWAKKGAPKAKRGKWDIKALMEWRYGQGGQKETPEARKLRAEADLKETKAQQEKIKLGVTRTEYLPVFEVKADLTRLFANLKKSLLAISHNVASNLGGIDPDAAELVKTEIDKRITDALTEMSKGEVYDGRKHRKHRSNRGRK